MDWAPFGKKVVAVQFFSIVAIRCNQDFSKCPYIVGVHSSGVVVKSGSTVITHLCAWMHSFSHFLFFTD